VCEARFGLCIGINDYKDTPGFESLEDSHKNIDFMKKFLNEKGYETKTLREGVRDGLEEWTKASMFLKQVARSRQG
jgi:hypothetical protein